MTADATTRWPPISVVIATVDRPVLLRRAVSAVLDQDYPGPIQCVVVFDRGEPKPVDVEADGTHRELKLIRNTRTPGLAGARNAGIDAAVGELVAFCDDDDVWLPGKLVRQVRLWSEDPAASCVATSIVIDGGETQHERLAPARTTFQDFLRSRVTAIHPSSLLFRRADLLGGIGFVDEALPGSYGEDYELLLRAARTGDVIAVPEPLVRVDWARPSYFAGKWDMISDGLTYILDRVPEFAGERRGRARIEGQIAFAHAARSRRRPALRWAGRALAHNPAQLRAYGALAVATGVVPAQWLLDKVQERGRGL
ncbi:glycosyltransferase family 2 protein [Phytoactinopolyspora limicola]|uniref:glycosyltransferase family 2 protein n=1 Tax=Phytoactinopolyspora limicola TaxID=2715536 RepID=UPI00140AE145|nr:glycosyltransferase family 2 protein [Phytoactinopolyspora limicola]